MISSTFRILTVTYMPVSPQQSRAGKLALVRRWEVEGKTWFYIICWFLWCKYSLHDFKVPTWRHWRREETPQIGSLKPGGLTPAHSYTPAVSPARHYPRASISYIKLSLLNQAFYNFTSSFSSLNLLSCTLTPNQAGRQLSLIRPFSSSTKSLPVWQSYLHINYLVSFWGERVLLLSHMSQIDTFSSNLECLYGMIRIKIWTIAYFNIWIYFVLDKSTNKWGRKENSS